MKTSILVLMLAVCPFAFGQGWKREATETEAAWHKLQILLTEDLDSLREHMALHGVVFEDLAKVRAYAESSIKEVSAAVAASKEQACDNREQLAEDQDHLIQALQSIEAAETAAAAKAIERLPEAVGEVDARAFMHYAVHEGSVTVGGVDYVALVRSGNADVSRICRTEEAQ